VCLIFAKKGGVAVPDLELDTLRLELRSLRVKVGEVAQELQKTQAYFDTLIRSFGNILMHIERLGYAIAADFEARTGIEVTKAQLLIPAGMATSAKKAVTRRPDPIKKNADKATSTPRRAAKPATH
jgi:hypothetical protein